MVNGTDSVIHEFDGCMYGLKSQFKDAGTSIKKPWRIVSRGGSFSDLHEKCDGSHAHGPCAGRETRATQLYTEKIVRCIIRGVKNQMLWNNAKGMKQPKKNSSTMSMSKPRNKACTCISLSTVEDELRMIQHCGQQLLDWILPPRWLEGEARTYPSPRDVRCRSGFPSGWYPCCDGREEADCCFGSKRLCNIEEHIDDGRNERSSRPAASTILDYRRG